MASRPRQRFNLACYLPLDIESVFGMSYRFLVTELGVQLNNVQDASPGTSGSGEHSGPRFVFEG